MSVSKRLRNSLMCLILVFLCGMFSSSALADVNGTILGTVTDSSGAVIPNAKITLRNAATGLERQLVTGQDGAFEFLAVPVGDDYEIDAQANGFNRNQRTGLKLLVNQRLRVDFELKVGNTSEEVTVKSTNVQVETSSTQLGEVIEDNKITAMPLNGRSYVDLLSLQAGVAPYSSSEPTFGPGAGIVSVNGNRENSNGYQINGGAVENFTNNSAMIEPTLDSIQEFRIITNSFDAEYGQYSGAAVNVITKSGTNDLHGTAFEFLRNSALDSRNFFDPVGPVGLYHRSQFGGVIGGPIKKNRLFFFGDYQGTRETRALTSGITQVPTNLERSGDFSDTGTAGNGYSPLSGTVQGDSSPGAMAAVLSSRLGYTVSPGEPYYLPGCNTQADAVAGTCVFPGEVIPQAAWSSAATGTIKFIAKPTAQNGTTYNTNGYAYSAKEDKFAVKVDWNTNRFGNFAFYYFGDPTHNVNPFGGGNFPIFASTSKERSQQANISHTKVGRSIVNEIRLNWTRDDSPAVVAPGGLGTPDSFGFQSGGLGLIPSFPSAEGLPSISLQQLGISFGEPTPNAYFQDITQIQEGFSLLRGRHSWKFGGSFAYAQWNRRSAPGPNGSFAFSGSETGNDFADYLLGAVAPNNFNQGSVQALDGRSKSGSAYIQDSFRMNPAVVLNYGLRWEFAEPWSDWQGKLQTFKPNQQSTVFPNAPRGWLFPGDSGVPSTLAPTRWNDFAPRVGIAYSPSSSNGLSKTLFGAPGQMSIRAGGGIFFTSFDTEGENWATGDAPFGFFYVSPTGVYLEEPYKNRLGSVDPGQRFPYTAPKGAATDFSKFLPISYSPAYNTDNVQPNSLNYNLTIQRQLGRTAVLSVGYVGSQGRHLYTQIANNLGNAALCLQLASAGCGPYGEDQIYTLNGQTYYGTRQYSVTSGKYLSQGLLDFGNNTYESTIANSSFNSLQVTLNKSVGSWQFLAAYTYGKSMDNSSGFLDLTNPFDPHRSRALSAFDLRQNFVVSYTYDLPFGGWIASKNGLVGRLVGGWQVNGITRLATGVPVLISALGDQSLCGCDGLGTSAVNLPDYNGRGVKTLNPRRSASHFYFDTSNFSQQALGEVGTSSRRFFYGPGANNTDISLVKATKITEKRISLDFRAEFFNVFNHTQFGGPSGTFGTSNFGQVTSANDPRIGQLALKLIF